jgi:transcription-repair coupling factor (superfamily II helicase)
VKQILNRYLEHPKSKEVLSFIRSDSKGINIQSLAGSSLAFLIAQIYNQINNSPLLVIIPNDEEAAYLLNDLESIFDEQNLEYSKKNILFFPASYKKTYQINERENANTLLRSEALNRLSSKNNPIIITYPEAIMEKVISKKNFEKNIIKVSLNDTLSLDFLIDVLEEYSFERVDFVVQSGEYALRGGIVDVFSFSDDMPYRIEFFGDNIESIRSFDVVSQLTIKTLNEITIVPNIENKEEDKQEKVSLIDYLSENSTIFIRDLALCCDILDKEFIKAKDAYISSLKEGEKKNTSFKKNFLLKDDFKKEIKEHKLIEIGNNPIIYKNNPIVFDTFSSPPFNKNFSLMVSALKENAINHFTNYFFIENPKQKVRLEKILNEFNKDSSFLNVEYVPKSIYAGFVDNDIRIAVFTDHEIFERYHKFIIRDQKENIEAITLKELTQLKVGDYITHIDYGIGKFAGLEKLNNNGKEQETIRLLYKDNDILYVSIHSLHKISRYTSKEGTIPVLHRLGSNTWNNLKSKTKQQVKNIAKDLIALYAKRKASKGYAFSGDNYLQNELEASFIYEDTPDQYKATKAVKKDMESTTPMDRLICGDVGFGKTEIAIRAAFKAVNDSKQVAVLVPTTILAYQHYKTFSERLENMPVRVDYINRFRSIKEKNQILKDLKDGKIDILIGTHKLLSKEVVFKDLGLLIIDEEHKFGVAMKEKLKNLKVNIDTLTLTATPIPRTLQFSLMGARDLSIINTPPQNRQPITTKVLPFDKETIKDAILFELSRRGQVYFVHNRVQNIEQIAQEIRQLVPNVKLVTAHGQMKGNELEQVMYDFIEGNYDVLLSTTIIENGLDIPNANTIIINDAQNYGLSDLHQLRGRVGRSNRKAYCYLLTPPMSLLTQEAQKRLKAIEDFSNIGSGFSIAMRDLDIRGSGNILGAEQSGFISEIGFDMYHKILNEAIEELKQKEFNYLYQDEKKQTRNLDGYWSKECIIETDLEILIPDSYVTNITQRLNLYKELDSLTSEEELEKFSYQLKDRFGKIPKQTLELIDAIRLRDMAKRIGFEKLVIKQDKLSATFAFEKDDEYFNSEAFSNVLTFIQSYPLYTKLKETSNKLTIIINPIKSIKEAMNSFKKMI